MKTILLILIAYTLNAQDLEPVSMSFTYLGTPININQDRFKQNNFLLGWQWGGYNRMIHSMGSNVIAAGGFGVKTWETYEKPNYVIAQAGKNAIAWDRAFIQAAAWLTYEPGLIIPENESFVTITDDPSNPVFGFKYITEYGTLTFTNDADDFNKKHYRLALYQDEFSSSTQSQELVLSNPWPNDVLYTKSSWAQDARRKHKELIVKK